MDQTVGASMTPAEHRTFRVFAFGSTDAADNAKKQAREQGWRVRTVCSIRLLGKVEGNVREWDVELAVVPR